MTRLSFSATAACLAALWPAAALAQAMEPAPAPAPAAPSGPAAGTIYEPPSRTYGPETGRSGTIGGGNATESSAHPVTGDEEDSFDLGQGRGSGRVAVHGDANGPIFVGGGGGATSGGVGWGGEPPGSHVVRRGDTLWDICDFYFQNPYQWPRIWSYNPQIKNPHWIYPGDEIRLKGGGEAGTERTGMAPGGVAPPYQQQTLVDRRRQVPSGTVFLRDQGWIRDPNDEVWGDVTGSPQDKLFLTDGDEVYLHVEKGHDVRLGQEVSVFKPVKSTAGGTIVQINGTVRVDQYDAQDRVARAQVIESLGPIERGARVGPIARKFDVVPPKRNETDVQAHVLASVHPEQFWGQNQVVFVDKGEAAGLQPGNRLFIVRRGDAWRKTLVTSSAGWRISTDDERLPTMERTPGSRKDEENYPDEVVGELRVLTVKKDSATCLVTQSKVEIEPYDLAVARKGY